MAKQISFSIKLSVDGKEQLVTATTSTKELKKAMEGARTSSAQLRDAMMTLSSVGNIANNLSSAFSSLQGQLQGLSKTYANAEQANVKLATIMKQRMSANDEDVASVKKVISAQTELGIIGGTVQKSGAQQVATFLTEKESLEALIPAMNNLLAQQKGVNATQEDAVGIGNLMGKAMQGQTSALRRVGITFSEAEEEVMKFGDESERATMLAQIITNNVGNMNSELAKTSAGQIKQLENSFGSLKVQIGEIAIQALPFVSMAAQSMTLLTSITNLVTGLKAFNVVQLATAVSSKAAAGAMFILTGRATSTAVVTRVLSAALKGTAYQAVAAKIAIRGLLTATVVGAAFVALSAAIEALTGSFGKAEAESGKFNSALEDSKQSAENIKQAYEQTMSGTLASLMTKYQQLQAQWEALSTSQEKAKWIKENQGAFQELGLSINTVADAEKAMVGNTDAVVAGFKKRAEAAAYAAKLQALYSRQIELADKKTEMLKNVKWNEDDYKVFEETDRELQKINKEIDSTSKSMAKLNSETAKASGKSSGSGKSVTAGARRTTSTPSNEVHGLVWQYETVISKNDKAMREAADEDTAAYYAEQKKAAEEKYKDFKIRIGLEQPADGDVKAGLEEMRKQLEDSGKSMGSSLTDIGMDPIKITFDTEEAQEDLSGMIEGLGSIDLSSLSSVRSAIGDVMSISNQTAKGFAVAGASCAALGSAMQQLGEDSAAAKAGLIMGALGQLALSFAQAMASTRTWVDWLAFGITGTAQLISMVSTLSGFASGGIVGGGSTSGDRELIRVNAGEMVLNKQQQSRLFAILDGQRRLTMPDMSAPSVSLDVARLGNSLESPATGGTVRFEVQGRKLVGALANETRVSSKSGRRTGIVI